MSIGQTIRRLRLERGLSQTTLASMAGTTRAQVRWIEESPTSTLTADCSLLTALCSALGVSLAELLTAAGLLPAEDPVLFAQQAELARLLATMPPERRAEAIAIIRSISLLPPLAGSMPSTTRSQGGEPCPDPKPPSRPSP